MNYQNWKKTDKQIFLLKVIILLIIFAFHILNYNILYSAISASSAILVCAETGKILYQKNINKKMHPASTTKILTAILLLEKGKLQDEIIVSKNASERKANESAIWLKAGEKITVENLLYAILLRSANDACVAAGEYISGSEEKFVQLMNNTAKKIGAKNTHFANPHGMTDKNHYTTAYDLAQIARYCIRNEKFCEIVKTRKKIIPWEGNPWNRLLINKNKLLKKYLYADGIKTGFTKEAGWCLVASATKNNWKLISVIFKSEHRYDDAISLFEYGFNKFTPQIFIDKNKEIKTKKLFFGTPELKIITKNKAMTVLQKDTSPIEAKAYLRLNNIKLPIKKGDIVGKLIFRDENKNEIASTFVIAGGDVNKNWRKIIFFYFIVFILAIGLFIFYHRRIKRKNTEIFQKISVK